MNSIDNRVQLIVYLRYAILDLKEEFRLRIFVWVLVEIVVHQECVGLEKIVSHCSCDTRYVELTVVFSDSFLNLC